MMLGNAMTAATLAVERVTSDLTRERGDVEVYLALGASPAQAAHPALRRAVAAALTPTLNAMLVVGVVKLPGMMTGQILGGSEPFQAAVYQLLILSGILFGDSLAATLSAVLWYRRLFTPAWQLDRVALARLRKRDG
jgi:putative ABC transport system permease protein